MVTFEKDQSGFQGSTQSQIMKTLKYTGALLLFILLMAFVKRSDDPTLLFLDTLNAEQRSEVMHEFTDASRIKWHFLPSQMWPREGITIGALSKQQKDLFFKMLRSFLGEVGYNKTQRIIDLENVLAELQNNPEFRDAGAYFIAIYGNPRKDTLWGWSFEGHHVSLNFTISDGKVAVAPRFFGSNPATIMSGPRTGERTLAREEDLAFAFMNALTAEQRAKAVFREEAFPDITTANLPEVKPLDPVGIAAKDLKTGQRDLLRNLIDEYLSALPDPLAEARRKTINKEEFDTIRFGWAGALLKGKPHYYRVQGKTFLIEFDNTQNNANHIHLVWRDFDGDFGRDLIREHYENSNHH